MSPLPSALPRSETKAKLLKHLHLSEHVFTIMASEADVVYRDLVSDRSNLKPSQQNAEPPYDWNHISERSREEAINKLANGGNSVTSQYWRIGSIPLRNSGLPWLPVWFLYKTFRHRDGRARAARQNVPAPMTQNGYDYTPTGAVAHRTTYSYVANSVNFVNTTTSMQDPASSATHFANVESTATRSFYDPIREVYIEMNS